MVKSAIDLPDNKSSEPELRPEFIEKMKKRRREPTVKVKDVRMLKTSK
ncbi:MAG: hypothetical protein ACE5IO_07025 [Thermoplasmata archaeon]